MSNNRVKIYKKINLYSLNTISVKKLKDMLTDNS